MNEPAESTSPSVAPLALDVRARDWWQATFAEGGGDRAVRARLVRCRTPLDAVTVPAALSLARRLGRIPDASAPAFRQRGFERALALAVVLAHVRTATATPLLRALGWGAFPLDSKATERGDASPVLSELRFRRLLQTEGDPELIAAFSRLLALAKGAADPAELARVLLHWEQDRTKRDLALTYFAAKAIGLE
jgi:CRISPR system Cascade subunit CasB